MNEPQWVGIIVRPIDYSLKGSVLHIDTGPGLKIKESHAIEMERYSDVSQKTADLANCEGAEKNGCLDVTEELNHLTLRDGKIELPDWASNMTSILWVPIHAINDSLAQGTSSGKDIDVKCFVDSVSLAECICVNVCPHH